MPVYMEKKIADFKSGDSVQGVFYIRESELKTTTTNNKYMNFTFADKTGEINAKLWDWDEENASRFRAGILVKARGSVLDWQGQPQFKIDFMGKVLDSDHIKIEDYNSFGAVFRRGDASLCEDGDSGKNAGRRVSENYFLYH